MSGVNSEATGQRDEDATLQAAQLEFFKRDRTDARRAQTQQMIEFLCESIPDRNAELRVADLGGGDGVVLDGLLEALPNARGMLVDLAQEMVDANRPHPRKRAVRGDLAHLDASLAPDERFDIIFFNVVLHHCLGSSPAETRRLQERILREATSRLTPTGRIFVLEQIHESPIFPDFSSHLIYHLTKSRSLAPLTGRFGANTAGVGVLFASERRLHRLFDDAGLDVCDERVLRHGRLRLSTLAVASTNSKQRLYVLEPQKRVAPPPLASKREGMI